MTYKLLVEFERDYGDDSSVIGNPEATPHDLAKQLAAELQEAYDELAIAGHFQVKEVLIHNERYIFDSEGFNKA